jgi:hypothetical protein
MSKEKKPDPGSYAARVARDRKPVLVTMSEEDLAKVNEIAEMRQRSRSAIIGDAINLYYAMLFKGESQ